jgi:hypothetical protein
MEMDLQEKCPWCGNAVSHEKFIQIEQERKKFEQAEAAIRQRLEAEFSQRVEEATSTAAQQHQEETKKVVAQATADREKMAAQIALAQAGQAEARRQAQAEKESAEAIKRNVQQQIEAEKKAAAEKYQQELNKVAAQAVADQEKMVTRMAQIEAKEAEARKQAQAEKESAEAIKKDLQRQIEAAKQAALQQARQETQKESAAREAEFREQYQQLQFSMSHAQKQLQQANEAKAALEKNFNQRLESEKVAAERRAKQEAEASHKKDVDHLKAILEQEHASDLRKLKLEFQAQNEAAHKKVQEAEHKYQELKTSYQLGDGAEVDLYEKLRQEFPADKITRVLKGQPGPDIRHFVMHKGEKCGLIVYDSKNQLKFLSAWPSKLHQDQIDAGAAHAILATTVFPADKDKQQLYIDDSGVVVVSSARAVHIARLLRDAMILMHVRGLGQKERAGKTNRLYEYITSTEHKQKFDELVRLNKAILQVDADEKDAHTKVWNKRGALLKKQEHALGEIGTEVAAIVEAPPAEKTSAA